MANLVSTKTIISSVVSLLLLSCSAVEAEDLPDKSVKSVADNTAQSSSSSKPSQNSSSGTPFGLAMIPGVCLGTAVGLPVCLFRRLGHDIVEGAHGMVGDTNNKLLLVPAAALWSPLAFCTAAMECPVYAIRDAWMAEKPFSKEQFSLGEMPAYDKQ